MNRLAVTLLSILAVIGSILVYGQDKILINQKAQMKQQYHSDFISLISLFGEDGLKKLTSVREPKELTMKEVFATGLLLQRFLVAHRIRDAWSADEWQAAETDIKAAMKSLQLLRARWEQIRSWYPKDDRDFLDKIVFDVLSEKEKINILRDRFEKENSK